MTTVRTAWLTQRKRSTKRVDMCRIVGRRRWTAVGPILLTFLIVSACGSSEIAGPSGVVGDADPGGWLTVCLGCEAWDDGRSDPRRRGYEREEAAAFVDAG